MKPSFNITIITLVSAALSITYAHYGARYEPPDGRTYHGVGWHNLSQIEYFNIFPDSLQPILVQFMSPLPGDVQRRGGMTVERLMNGFQAEHIDEDRQYSEMSVHFTDNTNTLDTTFALTDRLDGFIDTMAIAFRQHNRPIFLRIGGEMNGAWNGYTPWVFPLAFRKLVEGLRDRDVENFASIWCYEPDAPDDFADSTREGWKWYPGDDVVDWFGLVPFDVDHFDPDTPDSVEQRERWVISKKGKTEKFLRFAEARGKPVYLNELTARHVWITPYDEEVDSTHGSVDWEAWFAPFFEFLDNHPGIKAMNYINLDWTQYDHWEHWGDARLQINEYIRDRWVEELSGERFIHAGYEIPQAVYDNAEVVPEDFNLSTYPNPFNSYSTIKFELDRTANTTISLYDLNGRRMADLVTGQFSAGSHSFIWDAGDLPSGLYLIRLTTPGRSHSVKAALVK